LINVFIASDYLPFSLKLTEKKFGALKWDLNPWSKKVFNWSKNNFQMVKLTYPKGWTA